MQLVENGRIRLTTSSLLSWIYRSKCALSSGRCPELQCEPSQAFSKQLRLLDVDSTD